MRNRVANCQWIYVCVSDCEWNGIALEIQLQLII